jgi:hypothetical protein
MLARQLSAITVSLNRYLRSDSMCSSLASELCSDRRHQCDPSSAQVIRVVYNKACRHYFIASPSFKTIGHRFDSTRSSIIRLGIDMLAKVVDSYNVCCWICHLMQSLLVHDLRWSKAAFQPSSGQATMV